MIDESKIAERYEGLGPELNERQRRLWAASEARSHGRGGIIAVSRATGISEDTVQRGIAELRDGTRLEAGRVRRPGAGRPRLTDSDPELLGALEALVDPVTRGDPESPLRWSSKSLQKLAGALGAAEHQVSDRTTGKLLRGSGFGCTRTPRRGRVRIILTVTRSFGISTRRHARRSPRISR